MAEMRSTIPEFSGAAYQSWATKLQYGLVEKELIEWVCEFKEMPRVHCPALITPLTQGDIDALPENAKRAAIRENDANIQTAANAHKEWKKSDLKAQAFIVKYLGVGELTHIRHCNFAYEMWDVLKRFYSLKSNIEISNANMRLSALSQAEAEDLTSFSKRLQEVHDLLDTLGEPVSAEKQANNFLNSLNTRYQPMVETLQPWSLGAPHLYNIPTLLSTLQQRDTRFDIFAQKRGEPLANHSAALYTNPGPNGRGTWSGSKGGYHGNHGAGVKTCHTCGKAGHLMKECPRNQRQNSNTARNFTTGQHMKTCHNCQRMGHVKRECRFPGGDAHVAKNQGGGGDKTKLCLYCGDTGHIQPECLIRNKSEKVRAAMAAKHDDFEIPVNPVTFTVMTSPQILSATNSNASLILDSGASEHIVPDRSYFNSYSSDVPLSEAFIYTADNMPHEVKGHGLVELLLHQGSQSTKVAIHALHVPSLGQHLISLSCINKRGGVSFSLNEHGVPALNYQGHTWADVNTTANGLLVLSGHVLRPANSDACLHRQALSAGMSWHLRLGHPGLPVMKSLSAKGILPKLAASEIAEVQGCEVCVSAKAKQSPHSHESQSTKECNSKMDRIHLDLVGPISVASHNGGFTYFQSCMEVSTRLSHVSLLKKKSDALEMTKKVVATLEGQSGRRLKSVRTDGGGEYDGKSWQEWSQTPGREFDLQRTAPYSPEQNGIAERLNRTLLEKMRCMLIWSKLPASFWDVAVLHACYVRNRTPTNALQGDIPIEVWSGRECKVKELHTFGCLVQYLRVGHDKGRKSEKFASKTAYGIFLGMAQGQAGFLILDPTRAKKIVRTNVVFHESIPGYPRLVGRAALPASQPPPDADFFSLFPSEDQAQPASQPATPTIIPSLTPIDVVQLSSDTESGVHGNGGDNLSNESDGDGGNGDESIAERVAARRRALLAHFGDFL